MTVPFFKFSGEDVEKKISILSGGEKSRLALTKILLSPPNLLLMDEPTNHLDIPSIYWLESYLKAQFKGVLIFISHDIAFVNNVANYILDIDYGEIRQYTGNYNDFVRQKQEVIDLKMHQLSSMEKQAAKMKAFIDRFRAKASKARQAQSREKMLDKMILPDIEKTS